VSQQTIQRLEQTVDLKEQTICSLLEQVEQIKGELIQQQEESQVDLHKQKKFQEIILNENKVLSKQVLVLTEMYYDQHRNM
jgi:predicted ribosome-associated RNA-binding protein Tma20